jgi:hypothetical protein
MPFDDTWEDSEDDFWPVFEERFETEPYDMTWSEGSTVGAGCVLDPNQLVSSLPLIDAWWWRNLCLRVYSNGNNVYLQHKFSSDFTIAYFRIELVIQTTPFANDEYSDLFRLDNLAGQPICQAYIHKSAGFGDALWIYTYEDGTPNSTIIPNITFNAKIYRIELKWDQVNDEFELRINDVKYRDQIDKALTTDRKFGSIRVGSVDQTNWVQYFVDNVGVGTQDWLGAEGSSSSSASSSSSSSSSLSSSSSVSSSSSSSVSSSSSSSSSVSSSSSSSSLSSSSSSSVSSSSSSSVSSSSSSSSVVSSSSSSISSSSSSSSISSSSSSSSVSSSSSSSSVSSSSSSSSSVSSSSSSSSISSSSSSSSLSSSSSSSSSISSSSSSSSISSSSSSSSVSSSSSSSSVSSSSSSSSSVSSSSSSSSVSSSSSSSSISSSSSSSSVSSSSSSSSSVSSSSSSSISSSSSSSSSGIPADKDYSRGDYNVLPADAADLETLFTAQDYIDVADDDDVYVDQGATDEFAAFLFKDQNTGVDVFRVTWIGKSSLAPSTSVVKLQVYDWDSPTWEDLDEDNATAADTEFTLTGDILGDLDKYFDGSNWIACRVYQEAEVD